MSKLNLSETSRKEVKIPREAEIPLLLLLWKFSLKAEHGKPTKIQVRILQLPNNLMTYRSHKSQKPVKSGTSKENAQIRFWNENCICAFFIAKKEKSYEQNNRK